MIIKCDILETFRGTVSRKITIAKEFLDGIERRFVKNDKAKTSTLLGSLVLMKYQGQRNIREYIMQMSNIALKLKALKLELSDDLLVYLVLLSLPVQFNQFEVSYNCQKEKWTLNELISYCVQEEERLKQEKTESTHLVSTSKDKNKKRNKDKKVASGLTQKRRHKAQDQGCYFCKTFEHMKKDCTKYHAQRAKKVTLLALVCLEVNLAYVLRNTWWIDSDATTHISISMHGCLSYRASNDVERFIYVGDGKLVEVEAIGHFRLLLKTRIYLDLKETFIVPSFRRNLVYISILDKLGYTCCFENSQFSLYLNSNIVGTGSLSGFDNIYLLDILFHITKTCMFLHVVQK